jgi:hypothetical protein
MQTLINIFTPTKQCVNAVEDVIHQDKPPAVRISIKQMLKKSNYTNERHHLQSELFYQMQLNKEAKKLNLADTYYYLLYKYDILVNDEFNIKNNAKFDERLLKKTIRERLYIEEQIIELYILITKKYKNDIVFIDKLKNASDHIIHTQEKIIDKYIENQRKMVEKIKNYEKELHVSKIRLQKYEKDGNPEEWSEIIQYITRPILSVFDLQNYEY